MQVTESLRKINPHNKHKGNKRMKVYIICFIAMVVGLSMIAYGQYPQDKREKELSELNIEKARLEIQKLKYELSVYKEMEESGEYGLTSSD